MGSVPTRSKRILARLALILGGVLAGAAAAEVILRVFLPQTLGLRWYTREGVMVHVPGLRATYVRPEYRTRVEINSDGLRDREYPPGKPPGAYRILVLGDSYAEGLQVSVEQTFPKRIEALLAEARPEMRIEVVNAGIAGYGTADELRYLEAYGGRWRPDLVLLAFYSGNDVRNNLTEKGMKRREGKLDVTRASLTAWQYRIKGARNWIAAHSHLWQLLRARLTTGEGADAGPPRPSALGRGARGEHGPEGAPAPSQGIRQDLAVHDSSPSMERDRRDAPSAEVPADADRDPQQEAASDPLRAPWSETPFEEFDDREVMRIRQSPELARAWEVTGELIGRIEASALGLGAATAIVAIPGRWQSDTQLLTSRVGSAAVAAGEYDPALPGRVVCEVAAVRGLPCLDLLPGFRASGADASWYWKIDSHFTPKAHEAAARLIAPFLLDAVLPAISVRHASPPAIVGLDR